MESELDEMLSNSFIGNTSTKYITYKDLFVIDAYPSIADSIENFQVRDDDVWVCSFPRSGTTWTQEMVWNIANDLDFKAAELPMHERFPSLEFHGAALFSTTFTRPEKTNYRDSGFKTVSEIAELPSPRFIKTHLPFHLLPPQLREREKKCKVVYVSRNPKDVCISYYHYYKGLTRFSGTLESFGRSFLEGKVNYAPYWNHVNGYLARNDNNILCIKFEDMKSDLHSMIGRVATFLGKTLTDEQSTNLESRLSFARMKKNPAVNRELTFGKTVAKNVPGEDFARERDFIRSGEVGQWRAVMSEELVKRFDDWIEENSNKI